MPNIPCNNVLKACLPCLDDPLRNFSSEDPDFEIKLGLRTFIDEIKINETFTSLGCKRLCTSTVSQYDADDCAARQAFECVHDHVPLFYNTARACTVQCPDTTQTFTWIIAAGAIVSLSQADANAQAESLACKRAKANRICIGTLALPCACINEGYSQIFVAYGGTLGKFSDCEGYGYSWDIYSGSLPAGMELDPCTGELFNQPTESGEFTFTVRAIDGMGSFQIKEFTLTVLEISPSSPLPTANIDVFYNQALSVSGGQSDTAQWSVVSGTIPAGLELTSDGTLVGTPTGLGGSYEFTVEVQLTCP